MRCSWRSTLLFPICGIANKLHTAPCKIISSLLKFIEGKAPTLKYFYATFYDQIISAFPSIKKL